MKNTGPHDSTHARGSAGATGARSRQDPGARHGASAASQPLAVRPASPPRRSRNLAAILIGAAGATLVSLIFITSFMGALHHPGPRSVPVGIVGTRATAAAVSADLNRQAPGGFTAVSYSNPAAARGGIMDRRVDAVLVPGQRAERLEVATAAGPAVTDATIRDVHASTHAAGLRLAIQNVRPLPASNPAGISQVFFVVALLVPSLLYGNLLVTRFAKDLHPAWQLAGIVAYAAIVAAVATAITDAWIGALTGAPWGVFGIGALLAAAAAATAAAAARWAGGLGYIVILLLFVPIGIASSGTTLGPNMITPWYADLGKALLPGSALPAVQNTVYFRGSAITTPLLVLAAWAAGGAIALLLAPMLHPLARLPAEQAHLPAGTSAAAVS